MKNLHLALMLIIFICSTKPAFSQNPKGATYDLEFIQAEFTKERKQTEIILYFKYAKEKDDMTLMSSKITYNIGNKKKDVSEILDKSNHTIVVYGTNDIEQKNPDIYELLKEKIDFDTEKELFIFAFKLRNITKKYIDKMTFKYGLWEPSNPEIRFETEYDINIADKSSS